MENGIYNLGYVDRSVVIVLSPPLILSILFFKTPNSNVHTKNTRNQLARLVMGIFFLVNK